MADATANPRTEIRLTRFPSSIARTGDLAGEIVPLALVFDVLGSLKTRARGAVGGIRLTFVELCGATP
ncbi:hypothetical protein GCM10014713_52920 [Streptomyces purpureus]|uniref:Uncharacterized protein n=1 Tax=Streptomyces purpureus TaxID=1951 RepID=A0A918LTT7_9ACTN|nr:hypothetical protein GCM10014713_52920 [Streptomyces purpureus]